MRLPDNAERRRSSAIADGESTQLARAFHQDLANHPDQSGVFLLINELLAAADRGVRVRMLVDDIYGEQGDSVWAALDTHPDYDVRLFNPFLRSARLANRERVCGF